MLQLIALVLFSASFASQSCSSLSACTGRQPSERAPSMLLFVWGRWAASQDAHKRLQEQHHPTGELYIDCRSMTYRIRLYSMTREERKHANTGATRFGCCEVEIAGKSAMLIYHYCIVCRQDITEHRNLLMQLGARSRGIQLMTSFANQPSNMQNFGRAMSVLQPCIESMESRLQEAN